MCVSHTLLLFFAVDGGSCEHFCFCLPTLFLSFASFSMHTSHTDRRRKHLIAFYHENKHKPVLVCAVIISSRTLQHVKECVAGGVCPIHKKPVLVTSGSDEESKKKYVKRRNEKKGKKKKIKSEIVGKMWRLQCKRHGKKLL